ncbi:hypothetical protein R5R35_000942 [Gryllus longicercus]|uniref:Uncharacterized protein n=1 Tax=Gryllus longicercus TaxID=2509291 RepID=A0AAN9V679_9ORTH|nr:Uncharacterized protein GBIM_04169 [Gryllus bimaculatus]
MVAATSLLSQHIKTEGDLAKRPVSWRFPESGAKGKMLKRDRRDYFMRSASLDRLRQFPAYLCTRSSSAFPNVLLFLNTAITAVQAALKNGVALVQRYYLVGTVVAALIIVGLQLVLCSIVLFLGNKPPGLLFMVASLLLMAVIAYRTFVHRMPRSRFHKFKRS